MTIDSAELRRPRDIGCMQCAGVGGALHQLPFPRLARPTLLKVETPKLSRAANREMP